MIRNLQIFFICALCGWTPAALQAAATILSLDTGERIVGEVLPKSNDDVIYIQSKLLGEVAVSRTRVVKTEAKKEAEAKVPHEGSKVVVVQKKEDKEPIVEEQKTEIVLTEKEIEHIEQLRVIDTLRDLEAPESWSGNLRLGLNVSQGDTKWTESFIRGNLEIKPEASANFYRLQGSYTYRETERSGGSQFKSTDKYDAAAIYRRTFQEDWFFQNSLAARVDQIKGIDRELQETVGIGYKYEPNDRLEFILGGGGGVEEYETNFESSLEGTNPVLNVFQETVWAPFDRTKLVQKFDYYWNPEDTTQYNYIISAALRFRLTDLLGLEFSYSQEFDNDVGNGSSKDDTQWRNALIVYF